MKTQNELLIESRRLEALGRQYAVDYRSTRAAADINTPAVFPPRVLMEFPESRAGRRSVGATAEPERPRTRRWIEVAMNEGLLEYRLFQSQTEAAARDGSNRESDPEFVVASDSAFEALEEGYRLAETERIGEALIPFSEEASEEESIRSVEPALLEEIEMVVGAEDLTPADRIRARTDIVAFLEGRLEPSEFIAAAVERHGRREVEQEQISQQYRERILIDHP